MNTVAIIGTGIAGMVCGHYLSPQYDLTVYERNAYIGGHTNTILIEEEGRFIPIDTGFMVYNEVTYPQLTRLFKDLEVETKPTAMSFSVQHLPTGLEFCGSGINGLFAQRRNLLSPSFWSLLRQIARFNKQAPAMLDNPKYQSYTLKQYADEERYGEDFLQKYLIPMSSAVWSTPADAMLKFPVITLVRFFKNHGFLGLDTQHPWRTVVGGSRMYREKLIAAFKHKITVNRAAVRIGRQNGKALVTDSIGETRIYDKVILAAHANESLALLGDATPEERRLLEPFTYQKNIATLHVDTSVMPRTRSAWSSWNYRAEKTEGGPLQASTIYYMNSLQSVSKHRDYFVSINDPGRVQPEKILQKIVYDHPVFSLEAIAAQRQLERLNENDTTYFCGSYFKYGFHEDALVSGLNICRKLVPAWGAS